MSVDTPEVGICGNASPTLTVNGEPQGPAGICDLPAGHAGWHRGANINGGWGAPSYGTWGVLGSAPLPSATTTAVDIDLALSKIAALLPSNHDNTALRPTLAAALEAFAEYLAAGGELAALPYLTSPFLRSMRAVAEVIDTSNDGFLDGLRKLRESGEIAAIVFDEFTKQQPDYYIGLRLRLAIADALWDAGYRKTELTTPAGDPE